MEDSDKRLKWTENGRTELLKTPVFTVTERNSTGPDGQKGKYIVNEAPDWVIVIPVVEDAFLMVKQWRHGEKALSTEFPGGVVDAGELPFDAAKRELLEETGAVAGSLTLLGAFNPNPALFANHVHVFLAENLQFTGKQNLDGDEFLRAFRMKKEDLISGLGGPEFPHALMASALGLYLCKNGLKI